MSLVDSESAGRGTPLGLYIYKRLFGDNDNGEGSVIGSGTILRCGLREKGCLAVRFESNAQRHQLFDKWVGRIMVDSGVIKLLNKLGIRKALSQARIISIDRKKVDLEYLISQRGTETITCGVMGRFGPSLEDMAVLPH